MFGANTQGFAQDGTSAVLLNPGLRASGLSGRVPTVAFEVTGFISNDATFKSACALDLPLELCTLIRPLLRRPFSNGRRSAYKIQVLILDEVLFS